MTSFFIFTFTTCITTWAMAPRAFSWADARLARHRFAILPKPQPISAPTPLISRPTTQSRLTQLSILCDSLARESRSGMPHIDKIFADLNPHHADDALVRDLLLSCIVDGVFIPAALDHCAAILRDMSGCHADVAVAAAQATLSARILTYLPVGAVALILFVSASFRASLFTMPVLVPLALGIILNRIGWKWILRSISHTLLNRSTEVATLTDSLCVSLRSGRTMTQACEQWHGQTPAGTEVATFLRHGHSLENSLSPLSNSLGTHGTNLADIIRQAHQDGLPVVATVAQLSTDARHERRRAADILIRQLPTKLSIPLVLCVLPSFLLMAVAPIAISHLAQLTATPSLLSPT